MNKGRRDGFNLVDHFGFRMAQEGIPTWRQLGIEEAYLDAAQRNLTDRAASWWSPPPVAADAVHDLVDDVTTWGMVASAMHAIGYARWSSPFHDWAEVNKRIASAATLFFYGSWRERFVFLGEEYDRQKARSRLGWITYYREGLAAALAMGNWAAAKQLWDWPRPDLRWDEGLDDRTREDNAYQIWLASRPRGEADDAVEQQRQRVAGGKPRRPKMLMDAADALFAGDAIRFSKSLAQFTEFYGHHELETRRLDTCICLDATVLWHLAEHRGLDVPRLVGDFSFLIARPKTRAPIL